MGFNPDFDKLVDKQNQQNKDKGLFHVIASD